MEKRSGKPRRTPKFLRLVDICALLALIELSVIASYCQCRIRHSRHHTDTWTGESKVVISKKRSVPHGGYESTCSAFSSCEELLNSKCSAIVSQNETVLEGQLKTKLTQDFWCSCEKLACSITYKVDNSSSRLKNVFVRGLADPKAQISVTAEYFSHPGQTFQIVKLHGDPLNSGTLSEVEYNYARETDFLDVAVVNITMELNGGFSVIENVTIVLQDRPQKLVVEPRPADRFFLDQKSDANKAEWFDIDCAYADAVEDYWMYGCAIETEINDVSTTTGFWYPCQESQCSVYFDGSTAEDIRDVKLKGIFQAGDIELFGKTNLTGEWKVVGLAKFNSSVVHDYIFDLRKHPQIKVLRLNLISLDGGAMIVDNIEVSVGRTLEIKYGSEENIASATEKGATPSSTVVPAVKTHNLSNSLVVFHWLLLLTSTFGLALGSFLQEMTY